MVHDVFVGKIDSLPTHHQLSAAHHAAGRAPRRRACRARSFDRPRGAPGLCTRRAVRLCPPIRSTRGTTPGNPGDGFSGNTPARHRQTERPGSKRCRRRGKTFNTPREKAKSAYSEPASAHAISGHRSRRNYNCGAAIPPGTFPGSCVPDNSRPANRHWPTGRDSA